MLKRSYQSGAAKRKAKKKRIESEARGKQTLEELGWTAHCSRLARNRCEMHVEQHEEAPAEMVQ